MINSGNGTVYFIEDGSKESAWDRLNDKMFNGSVPIKWKSHYGQISDSVVVYVTEIPAIEKGCRPTFRFELATINRI